MMEEDLELISIYYGAETTEESAQKLKARIEENILPVILNCSMAGQPIYYYIISAE